MDFLNPIVQRPFFVSFRLCKCGLYKKRKGDTMEVRNIL